MTPWALHLRAAALLILWLSYPGCAPTNRDGRSVANDWAELSVRVIMADAARLPNYDSRSLGLLGLTMYESVVGGYPERRSLVGQLSELRYLPPPDAGLTYDWVTCLSSGQAAMLRALYPTADAQTAGLIDSLERYYRERREEIVGAEVVIRSERYGRLIAGQLLEWAKADGGHRGNQRSVNRWGANRPFLPANYLLPPPPIKPVGEQRNSDSEVPGAAYAHVSQQLRREGAALIDCAAIYAAAGMAVADAYVKCDRWSGARERLACGEMADTAVATVLGERGPEDASLGNRIGRNVVGLDWYR